MAWCVSFPNTRFTTQEHLCKREHQASSRDRLHRIRAPLTALEGIEAHRQDTQASAAQRDQLQDPAAADAALIPGAHTLLARLHCRALAAHQRAETVLQVHRSGCRATVVA